MASRRLSSCSTLRGRPSHRTGSCSSAEARLDPPGRDGGRRIMLTPISDEIADREPYNGCLIFQGDIPEIQEFLKTIER
jgi:hypothetical protein